MFLFKKMFWGLGLLTLIYLGGSGTQSSSLFMQGMGFIGLLIGFVILYIFGRMVWRGLGCLPSLLILAAVVLFMMYALGMFSNGLGGIGGQILKFIGYESQLEEMDSQNYDFPAGEDVYADEDIPLAGSSQDNKKALQKPQPADKARIGEDFPADASADLFGSGSVPPPLGSETPERQPAKKKSLTDSLVSALGGKEKQPRQKKPFNPNDYPVVYGSVRVINGDTLEMYGKYFKLFGIDAPESSQTCADGQGRAYNCGREAAMWLKSWIGDNELECHVIQQDTKGNMVGTCSYGPYDLGAALVNAGWAVAYTKYTDIYYAYEMQAQANRRGLWQGTFYKPWDWRKLQARKPKIKVIRPKKRTQGLFD